MDHDVNIFDTPVETVVVDWDEFGKATPVERAAYFRVLHQLENRGYFARRDRPTLAWACLDLDRFSSFDHYIKECRQIHKGNAIRDALKAEKQGYYAKFFNFRNYVADVVSIHTSSPIRGGKPMSANYQQTVADLGGYPVKNEPERLPTQAAVWVRHFGLFRKLPGHCQGSLVTDEQLVAYMSLRRYGTFAMYGAFIGHADFLKDGIMYRMHLDLVSQALGSRSLNDSTPEKYLRDIRFLGYTDFYNIRSGLLAWKRRMLFAPVFLNFDYLAGCALSQLWDIAGLDLQNAAWQMECIDMVIEFAQQQVELERRDVALNAQKEAASLLERISATFEGCAPVQERVVVTKAKLAELTVALGI
jgi:hypothetical protein